MDASIFQCAVSLPVCVGDINLNNGGTLVIVDDPQCQAVIWTADRKQSITPPRYNHTS